MTNKTQNTLTVRPIGVVHWRGMWTLFQRETQRFLVIWQHTVFAPMLTALLFLAIFHLALGGAGREINGMPFTLFVAPGLIMMAVLQNAFINTSTSIVISKLQNNIVDTLMAPLSPGELTIGYGMSGVVRGVMVFLSALVGVLIFVPLPFAHPLMMVLHLLNGAIMMSLVGVMTGIWAKDFDRHGMITNFVINPLAFLSGTFYSIKALPPFWQKVAFANPIFYVIDGVRFGILGFSDMDPVKGLIIVGALNLVLFYATYRLFKSGYRLKS